MSAVGQHLKVLREAGMMEVTIEVSRTCYALNRETLGELRDAGGSFR